MIVKRSVKKYIFRAVIVFSTLTLCFLLPVSAMYSPDDASVQMSLAPTFGTVYYNTQLHPTIYYDSVSNMTSGAGYFLDLSGSLRESSRNAFDDIDIMSVYNGEDTILFREGFYYSITIDYYFTLQDFPAAANYYDPSQTQFLLFNDSGIFDGDDLTTSQVTDSSCGFLPSSCSWVSDHYELVYNFTIDPADDLAASTRVNYGSIAGEDLYVYLFYSWGLLTPDLSVRFITDAGIDTSGAFYELPYHTVLKSVECNYYSSEEFWQNYIDGKIGELSEVIDHNVDRIISGDELTVPDISDIQDNNEYIDDQIDSMLSDVESVDIIDYFDVSDIFDFQPAFVSMSNWFQYTLESNLFLSVVVSFCFAWMIYVRFVRLLF